MKHSKLKSIFASLAIVTLSVPFAIAADGDMSGEELTALLAKGKTISLKGESHSGSLEIKSDGTASGSVQVSGKTIPLDGTWAINQSRFCRKWAIDASAEVCEVWNKIGDGRVAVLVDGKKIGINSWSTPANGDMTGEELVALIGAGKKINLGGDGEGHSGSLDIKGDGTASWTVQVQGKTIDDGGTWTINQNRFCRKWRTFDAGVEVCEVWRKIGDGRVVVLVDGKKIGLNWW